MFSQHFIGSEIWIDSYNLYAVFFPTCKEVGDTGGDMGIWASHRASGTKGNNVGKRLTQYVARGNIINLGYYYYEQRHLF